MKFNINIETLKDNISAIVPAEVIAFIMMIKYKDVYDFAWVSFKTAFFAFIAAVFGLLAKDIYRFIKSSIIKFFIKKYPEKFKGEKWEKYYT